MLYLSISNRDGGDFFSFSFLIQNSDFFLGNTWVPLMAPCHYILAIDGTQTLWMCV
jgi:hypothetical protein